MTGPEVIIALLTGLVAGAISGALGVGGGAILVPAMVLLLGAGQETAQGTSLLVILPTALAGAYSHFRRGSLDFSPTWIIGLVGAAAAAGGAFIALHLGSSTLRIVFAVFLVVMGLREILRRSAAVEEPASSTRS
ncbi:MAG: sulfite exporter TauE/SafE family protein [Candidatus Dormiibacterota bacterium]